jgi:hypothetical protein
MKQVSDIRVLCLVTIGFLIFCLAFPLPIAGLKISGSKYVGTIAPGETANHTMIVSTKNDDVPMDIVVDVGGYQQSLDGGLNQLSPKDDISPYSARSYITVSPAKFHLNPGESKEVTASISLPKNVGDGGRYAVITIHNLPVGNSSTLFVTAIAVPVAVTIANSKLTRTGTITDLKVDEIIPGQPIRFTTSLKNTGNVHNSKTKNIVNISDSAGKEVNSVVLNQDIYSSIPPFTFNYVANLDTPLPPGTYTAKSKILLEDGTVLDTKTTTFVVQANYIPPLQAAITTLNSRNDGVLATPDRRVSINFPAGSVFSDTDVTLLPLAKDEVPSASPGITAASTAFKVDGITGLLAKDATVTVKYTSADLDAAGSDVSKLAIARYDDAFSNWTVLPTTLDRNALTLTSNTNRFGTLAVVVASAASSGGTSSTSGTGKPGLALNPIIAFAALGFTIMFVGFRIRK